MLACPAIGGFHPLVTYAWEKDGSPLSGENTPLFYCVDDGVYVCTVTGIKDVPINYSEQFKVACEENMHEHVQIICTSLDRHWKAHLCIHCERDRFSQDRLQDCVQNGFR